MKLDTVALAHRIHVLEAARHLLVTASLAGAEGAVLKQAVLGLRQADVLADEEAEALMVEFGLERV